MRYDYLKKYIKDNSKYAFIVNRNELGNLWNWFLFNYKPINVMSEFNDFYKYTTDAEKDFILLDTTEGKYLPDLCEELDKLPNLLYLRDFSKRNIYTDWSEWEIIDFKYIKRNELLNRILN